jgi:dolichol-phosphate mannosyltransferase
MIVEREEFYKWLTRNAACRAGLGFFHAEDNTIIHDCNASHPEVSSVELLTHMATLTVIIPTYNEAKNITPIIKRVHEFVPDAHILVADDNSPDGTGDIVRKLAADDPRITLFSRKGKEGLGKAYLAAFDEALKDPSIEWIQMLDADFSHDPKYLPDMLKKAQEVDVVIGSRYVKGGGTVAWPVWRRLLSWFANMYCRTITGMPINDTTAGFILMRTSFMRKANLNSINAKGHAFMMEIKYRLWKHGARMVEVPVILEDRQQGVSKMSNGVIREAALAPWKMRFSKSV